MSKRVWITVAAVVVAIVAGVVLLALPREPSYEGRRLASWLEDLSTTQFFWSFSGRGVPIVGLISFPAGSAAAQLNLDSKARDAIGHIGTNALPRLVQLIRHQDSPFSLKVLSLIK